MNKLFHLARWMQARLQRAPRHAAVIATLALVAAASFAASPALAQATASVATSFLPTSITVGGTASVTFAITNPAGPTGAFGVTFSDSLPSGLVVATPSGLTIADNSTAGCNGATVTATAGSGTISFSTPQLGILATCLVSVNVTGTTAGAKVNTVVVSSQSAGTSTAAATLTVNQLSSSTALVSSLNPSNSGQAVTFTATVTGTGGGGTPTGTVTFKDGSSVLGAPVTLVAGVAAFTTSTLSGGPHTITAVYNGDPTFAASSATLGQAVNGVTATTLTSSANPSQAHQPVTFTASVAGVSPTGTATFRDGGTVLGAVALSGGAASLTVATLSVGTHAITATYSGDASNLPSTSAALQQAVNIPTDSLKARALQIVASKIVATNSGAAISGAVDAAISDAFNGGGAPVTIGPTGMTFNFTAEPRAETPSRNDEALAALGYAKDGRGLITKAPPPVAAAARDWSLWADIRGTGFDNSTPNADLRGTQLNVTAGLGRKLTPDLLVGVFTGYEHFNYDVASLAGTLKGDGGTVGGYAAWRFAPSLRWDATLGWSGVSYNDIAGTANGSFNGSRWLASTGLTGSYHWTALIFEPSAKVFALWERQGEWTDSLGTLQAARNFSAGRVASGGKVIAPWQIANGTVVAPYLGVYADYRFSSDNALPAGQPLVGIGDGWSGRVTGGVTFTPIGSTNVALGGEYGGLGATYKVWTATGRVFWPF